MKAARKVKIEICFILNPRGMQDVSSETSVRLNSSSSTASKGILLLVYVLRNPSFIMSQMHSHGPGQPMHSHGPPQQQQQQIMRPPDPVMQQLIEESFQPVDIVLGSPDNSSVLCAPHSLEKCAACDADYTALNRISRTLQMNPNLRCPPPPNIVSQKLSQAINTTKEEGNVRFIYIHCIFVL